MREPKYFCSKCKTTRDQKKTETGELVFTLYKATIELENGTKETKEVQARKLECGHHIPLSTPGFYDENSENLNEHETLLIRREIDKTLTGKQMREYEKQVLYWCEQYQTLLKIASKMKQQAKYAQLYLDQLREKYIELLSEPTEKKIFEEKFWHFYGSKPTSDKQIERERTSVDKAAEKQKAVEAQIKAMLNKSGFKPKDLFKKDDGDDDAAPLVPVK